MKQMAADVKHKKTGTKYVIYDGEIHKKLFFPSSKPHPPPPPRPTPHFHVRELHFHQSVCILFTTITYACLLSIGIAIIMDA